MTGRASLALVACAIALCAGVGGVDACAAAADGTDDAVAAHLVRVHAAAARAAPLAVAAGTGLLGNHDALVDAVEELRAAVVELDAAASVKLLDDKDRYVDDVELLKARRGALTGIERHLFQLLREDRRTASSAAAGAKLDETKDALLAYLLAPEQRALGALDAERRALAAEPPPLADLALHLGVLVDQRRTIDDQALAFLRGDLVLDVVALEDALRAATAKRHARERCERGALVAALALAALARIVRPRSRVAAS